METLVYASAAAEAAPDLKDILAVSRRNNARNGLTGLLLFAEGNFIQALEGPGEALKATYERILKDPRHKLIIELYRAPIERRNFPDWSMGARTIEGADIPGGAFKLTRASLEEIHSHDRGEEVFTLLKSFYRVSYPDDMAS
ncbi:BLUF domain-containing protein [Hyphococcus luteus]|uniref:BLUF domain-containing protein n=1 Tax=Hyphococcus luteus TaxID=2058213 RepID=A0A2S7K2C5_9PROT|nr:BLUF domain-containing protein [Marinicaulis flavus]PQA86631.1 hypothetical protein CW354_19505 [Marinicaulis flavus]